MGFSYLKSKIIFFNYCQSKTSPSSLGLIEKAITCYRPSCLTNSRHLHSRSYGVIGSTRYKFLIPSTFSVYGLNQGVRFYRANRYPFANIINRNAAYRKWISQLAKSELVSSLLRFVKNHKILTFLIVTTIVFGSVERVPYSNRTHLVFASDRFERYVGDQMWEEEKKNQESKTIYGQTNPETIRVRKILVRILDAMHSGLRLDHGFSVCGVPTQQVFLDSDENYNAVFFYRQKVKAVDTVKKVRNKRGSIFWFKFGTKHLEGLNWELMLVKSHEENASYTPNGKILVYERLAKGHTDTEIATVIAHEIGHGVARHGGETLMRIFWYLVLGFLLFRNIEKKESKETLSKLLGKVLGFLELYLSRRRELEADYIGLMLMASAGYDPRAAPDFYEKLNASAEEHNTLESTHPPGEKRARMLKRKKVMGKAVAVYEQVRAGHSVKNFI